MLLWSKLEVWSNTTKCVKNIPCPMEEDKPLLLALVSGDIRDDEEFTDVTLAWEDGLPIEAHKAILVGWSPQTNTPIPWSKLEVCSPIRKLSVPFLGPGFVEESETLESKTKERWGLNQTQTALLQECFSSDICDRHRVVAAFLLFIPHVSHFLRI